MRKAGRVRAASVSGTETGRKAQQREGGVTLAAAGALARHCQGQL